MEIERFFAWFNEVSAVPATILFLGTGIFLTLKTGFLQIRGIPRFIRLISKGVKESQSREMRTINAFHALFTAMATTIGIGNVVSPTLAIRVGGPGALFWLIVYMFFASATKFTEVTFALETRTKTDKGEIIGGPMQYLRRVSHVLAAWYGIVMSFLFVYWSTVQSNTLANVFALESIPQWIVGCVLSLFVLVTLLGGAKRVGFVASKLVPIMFVFYVFFAMLILFHDWVALKGAVMLIVNNIFTASAAIGGFMGATIFKAMHAGIYRAIFISESGLGVSSIPHSVADTQRPTDQGILAMFSAVADITLSLISGLLVLVTGIWMNGAFRSTMTYEVFKMYSPCVGQIILLISVSLFVLTTVLGNTFNGMQSFASITRYRFMRPYLALAICSIFIGALMPVSLVWQMMDTLLTLAAIPNLIGILILAMRYPQVLKR